MTLKSTPNFASGKIKFSGSLTAHQDKLACIVKLLWITFNLSIYIITILLKMQFAMLQSILCLWVKSVLFQLLCVII